MIDAMSDDQRGQQMATEAVVPPPRLAAPPPPPSGGGCRIELRIQPAAFLELGDRLLVTTREHITMQDADDIRAEMSQQFPGVEVTVLHADEVLVYRPGGEAL